MRTTVNNSPHFGGYFKVSKESVKDARAVLENKVKDNFETFSRKTDGETVFKMVDHRDEMVIREFEGAKPPILFEFHKNEPFPTLEEKEFEHRRQLENAQERNQAMIKLANARLEMLKQVPAIIKERKKTLRGFFAKPDVSIN